METRHYRDMLVNNHSPIPPYLKAAFLGVTLMAIVVVTVIISYAGMRATFGTAQTAIYDYYPAHDELLFIDRDLYQGQMALERAARLGDSLGQDAQFTIFRENVGQTSARFSSYQEKTATIASQASAVASYLDYRNNWLQVAERLVEEIQAGLRPDEVDAAVDRTIDAFADMRFALDRITESVINPLLQSSEERMTTQAREARNRLLLTLILALVIGGFITTSGCSAIRRQYNEMLLDRDQRESEATRKELEKRMHDAFELVQTEAAAIDVISGVLEEIVAPVHQAELLLADSSMAHLGRATGTREADGKGCNVLKPAECPAIRRNARLSFPVGDTFEACPYLKSRCDDSCSALCMPVNVLGRTAGVLHTVGAKGVLPNETQDQALRALAARAGNILGTLRAFATKDRQANTDSLTGLENRRSLEAKLPAVVSRGVYTIAFGDLDRFKLLNDTHGHDMGDKALRLFADVLRASVRPDDLVGRWGGEEFVVVLPGSTDDKAIRVIERIRGRLQEILALGAVPSFTVSFGVCDSQNTDSFSDVINAADAALLRAKNEGRDRIIYGIVEEADDRLSEALPTEDPDADSGFYRRVSVA